MTEPTTEVGRLRQQNHDHAARRDREMAELQSQVDHYRNAYERAREIVRGTPVDWTNDPPSRKPDGWWNYTSQRNRDIIAAAVIRGILAKDAETTPSLRGALIAIRATLNLVDTEYAPTTVETYRQINVIIDAALWEDDH